MARSPSNYRVPTRRAASIVRADPKKLGTSKDGRWATGRNVKVAMPEGRFDIVEAWTLKERMPDGSVNVVASGVSREDAEAFVGVGLGFLGGR